MTKYLVEVPHGNDRYECLKSVHVFLTSGSHFLTHADWGCLDGVHKAWFFMEAMNKSEVLQVVPPAYRKDAVITELNKFTLNDVRELLDHHNTA